MSIGVLLSLAVVIGAADGPWTAFDVPEGVSAICVEAESGRVLFEKDADVARPPASMVKLIQMLLVCEGLRHGEWTLDTPVRVTRNAERMGGTQVFLKAGEAHELGDLMKAVAVASANDAAMAVAEGLWGSKEAYLERANERMRQLGMTNTTFRSVHGLPPEKGELPDATTARDMALLARACVREPLIREWTSMQELVFRPGQATQYNTNKLLWRMADCDGLKTGYIRAAGYCVTGTAQRDGARLIVVVMGHPNNNGRFALARDLLETGFTVLQTPAPSLTPVQAGK